MRIRDFSFGRVTLATAATLLLVAVTATLPAFAAVDTDLESGLACLVSGDNVRAAQFLARFGERQRDPKLRREIDSTIASLDQLRTPAAREQAARQLKSIALHWRYRNFPVFP